MMVNKKDVIIYNNLFPIIYPVFSNNPQNNNPASNENRILIISSLFRLLFTSFKSLKFCFKSLYKL